MAARIALMLVALAAVGAMKEGRATPLLGNLISPLVFTNPYAHIPAQCYVETAGGTQNACQFCHTNGPYQQKLGNNYPQAGAEPRLGDWQRVYRFAPFSNVAPSPSVIPWENTLFPERLAAAVAKTGQDPRTWDMESYIRQDNWGPAYAQRPGDARNWDSGVDHPLRLFPGLAPADLPAGEDGFVRTTDSQRRYFQDDKGSNTGWRAVNFMPYGLFTPLTGSVSGIYIRLPQSFMTESTGDYDLAIYRANLDLLERTIQDRLTSTDPAHYYGGAQDIPVQRGIYPVGTEFAHPLHYVDVAADGRDPAISPFPGTRSRRVKEVRYMYKVTPFDPGQFRPGEQEDGLPSYGNSQQGWVSNGAGWYLAGYIEQADGALRPQTREELASCIGCHSGVSAGEFTAVFTAGTGNTIDSTWSFPRKWPGEQGWREMDYLGYQADPQALADHTPGQAQRGDPRNRREGKGEFRYFLDNVVGGSLYGDMPASMERWLAEVITQANGYPANWPPLNLTSGEGFFASQHQRQQLMRWLTQRGDYLNAQGHLQGALLYPPRQDALASAARYRQVVVTQRYNRGKDVFPETPFTLRYYRPADRAFTHQDGRSYALGEVITDRPVERTSPASITYGIGITETLINPQHSQADGGTYNPEYLPLLTVGQD